MKKNSHVRYDWSKVDPTTHTAEQIIKILGCSRQTAEARIRKARGALSEGKNAVMPAAQKMHIAIWVSKQDADKLQLLTDEEFVTELRIVDELAKYPFFPLSGVKTVRKELGVEYRRKESGTAARIRALEERITLLEALCCG